MLEKTSGASYAKDVIVIRPNVRNQFPMCELILDEYHGPVFDTRFHMNEIEVDGFYAVRYGLPNQPMFSLKDEENLFGEPDDTGLQQRVYFKTEISEKHWLQCGAVISKGSRCYVCEQRDFDE
jgi:hypothetical protein